LFSGEGGRMILYRPGHAPLVADSVPITYQLAKSVGHSSMAIYQIVAPYLANPAANRSWQNPLRAYQTQCQLALDGLEALELFAENRDVLRAILELNLNFMHDCLTRGTYTYDEVQQYIRACAP